MLVSLWCAALLGCATHDGISAHNQLSKTTDADNISMGNMSIHDEGGNESLQRPKAQKRVRGDTLMDRQRLTYPDASFVGMDALQMFYAMGRPDGYVIDGNAEIWHIRQYSGSANSGSVNYTSQGSRECVWRIFLAHDDNNILRVKLIEQSARAGLSCSSSVQRSSILWSP